MSRSKDSSFFQDLFLDKIKDLFRLDCIFFDLIIRRTKKSGIPFIFPLSRVFLLIQKDGTNAWFIDWLIDWLIDFNHFIQYSHWFQCFFLEKRSNSCIIEFDFGCFFVVHVDLVTFISYSIYAHCMKIFLFHICWLFRWNIVIALLSPWSVNKAFCFFGDSPSQ